MRLKLAVLLWMIDAFTSPLAHRLGRKSQWFERVRRRMFDTTWSCLPGIRRANGEEE